MKALVKEIAIFSLAIIAAYFLLSNTNLSSYFKNVFTGLFSLFNAQEKKVVYFEIFVDNSSTLEIDGKVGIKTRGAIKDSVISSLSFVQINDKSDINLECFNDNCVIKKAGDTLDFSGTLKSLAIDKVLINNEKGFDSKISITNVEYLNISITSSNVKICSSKMQISLSIAPKKISQTLENDCVEISGIVKVSYQEKADGSLLISGYAEGFKSSFISI